MKEADRGVDPERVVDTMQSIQRLCLSGWSFTVEHSRDWHVAAKVANDTLAGVGMVNRWGRSMMTTLEDIVDVVDAYGE